MDGGELNYHPRPGGVVEGARQLFVARFDQAEDSQVALMRTSGTILSERQELFENTLAESLQRHLAKVTEGPPARFRHVVGHEFLAV